MDEVNVEEMKMASATTPSHVPALAQPRAREQVGRELETTLQELVALSLTGKQVHWTVVGPTFRSLHRQVDELVASWRALADTVAERAVALGHIPDGQAAAVNAGAELSLVERAAIPDHDAVWKLLHRLAQVSERTRERMERVGELDVVSQDVLIEVVRALEEQQWMLRAQHSERES